MKWEAFFFDFDGTLVDSIPAKGAVFREMFVPFGNKIQDKVEEYHLKNPGMGRKEKFAHYYNEFLGHFIDENGIKILCDKFSLLSIERITQAPEIPGAMEFLERNYYWALYFVISAMPSGDLYKIIRMRKMNHFFKVIVGDCQSKEEIIRNIISCYNFDITKCLMFGDSDEDFEAADSLGMEFIKISKNQTFEDIMKKGIL